MSPRLLVPACLLSAALSFGFVRWMGRHDLEREASATGNGQAAGSSVKNGMTGVQGVLEEKGGEGVGKVSSFRELVLGFERSTGSLAEAHFKILDALGHMSAPDLVALLEGEAENPDFLRMARFDLQFAVRRLAEVSPEQATAFWMKHPDNFFLGRNALGSWAEKDPQAFTSWMVGLPSNLQNAAGWTFQNLAKEKPEQFAQLASQLGNLSMGPPAAVAAIQGMLSKAGPSKGDPNQALAYANALPEGPIRNAALAELIKWPNSDLAQVPEVVNALAQVGPDEARRLGASLGDSAARLPEGATREAAFTSAIKKQSEQDPVAATQRLDALAGTKDYPAAVVGFVKGTAVKDPAAAAEWALSIGSDSFGARATALATAAKAWFNKSPDEARAWVEKAPITDREYFQLTGRVRGQ